MDAEIALRFDPAVVALSYLIAAFASYVALDLAKRVRTPDRAVARAWWTAGSLSMGTGIWAMHFVGMLALKLPFPVGYDARLTALSWVIAVASSGIALRVAAEETLTPWPLAGGALSMGAGISAMHYTGMAALMLDPVVRWDWVLVAASLLIATGTAAVALCIFFWLRRLQRSQALWGQVAAALVMGAAVAGMHYTGMAAAGVAQGSVCLSAQALRGDNLGGLVAVATFALLLLTLLTSGLDARAQHRTRGLQQSLHAAETQLQRQAEQDALTGLANRRRLDDRLQQVAEGMRLALLAVNLDGFKPINDSFGHDAGDAVLREAAQRLQRLARSQDTLARLGADEFALLIQGEADDAALAGVAQRLLDALTPPMIGVPGAGSQPLRLSASVGIAIHAGAQSSQALIAQADSAAQSVKRAGGNGFAFFAAHMQAGMREQVELAHDLRAALARESGAGRLLLHYQPKINAASGEVSGVEALLRWQHPQRGAIGPAVFIPVAERFGLVAALGGWVIDEACRQLAEWRAQGLKLRVAINLSAQQLRQPEPLLQRLEDGLRRFTLDAALLTCELTESTVMEVADATERSLQRLGELGVRLSIDDFGTGYSSLAYLRRLPVSQLKIDRSFVQDLEASADARAIVNAVIELAHALGLQVVAEGVETPGQAAVLRAKGCDELQGFLFARPMPASDLAHWAAQARSMGSLGLRFSASAYGELDAGAGV